MNVVLSFIGEMPPYVKECVKQLRIFFKGPLYIIYSSISTPLKDELVALQATMIQYDEVKSSRFSSRFTKEKFAHVHGLKGREQLFLRSYERFFLLDELARLKNLENIWFMELDILMYEDPNKFLPALKDKPYAFAYHRPEHFNSGIFYVKNSAALQPILETLETFNGSFMSEMRALSAHYEKNPTTTLFPLIVPSGENRLFWKDYTLFDNYLFDGAIMGIYYFGLDPHHTAGKIVTKNTEVYNLKTNFLNIWNHGELTWIKHDENWIPYFRLKDTLQLLRVANLHIHSKDLISAVSYTPKK